MSQSSPQLCPAPRPARRITPALREIAGTQWGEFIPLPALYALPAVLALIVAGIVTGQEMAGLTASTGALAAGFGAVQRNFRSPVAPMLLVTLGAGVSAGIGTIAHGVIGGELIAAFLWGGGMAVLTVVGPGPGWLGLQGAVALLIAAAFPATPDYALYRCLLVFAGGLIQFVVLLSFYAIASQPFRRLQAPDSPRQTPALVLRESMRVVGGARPGRAYAVTSGLAVAAAALVAHAMPVANSYWVPMTVVLLLRPAARETTNRSLARFGGTVAAIGLLTVVIALLRPSTPWILLLLIPAAWGCFALVRVNYALLSLCITAYVVLLFALAGLPEPAVALHRTIATALGGAIAILAHGFCKRLGGLLGLEGCEITP